MTAKRSCCGGYIRVRSAVMETIKPNPKVKNGVEVIYLGSGNIAIKGSRSGKTYFASDHHRHFKVFKEDVDEMLKNSTVILKS